MSIINDYDNFIELVDKKGKKASSLDQLKKIIEDIIIKGKLYSVFSLYNTQNNEQFIRTGIIFNKVVSYYILVGQYHLESELKAE